MRPALSLLTALLLSATLPHPARAAQTATISFHISDETDPVEIREDTAVFINGTLVAHFILDATHPFASVAVTIQAAARYSYALCGRITIRSPDGRAETHVLDDGATLTNLAGRHMEALASDGFTTFYLGERSPAGTFSPLDLHKTNACSIPTS